MQKILIIDKCLQCDNKIKTGRIDGVYVPFYYKCTKKKRIIIDPFEIPSWCPLENIKELSGLLNLIQGCLLGGPDKEQKRLALKWIEEAQKIVLPNAEGKDG